MHQGIKINIKKQIETKLRSKLELTFFLIKDLSYLHSKHNTLASKGGTHFSVIIVTPNFNNHSLLDRHKIINKILKEEFKMIHALAIKAYTVEEYALFTKT